MLTAWLRDHRRALVLALSLFVLPIGIGVYLFTRTVSVSRTLKIGFQNSSPYHYPDAHGNASGPWSRPLPRFAGAKLRAAMSRFSP